MTNLHNNALSTTSLESEIEQTVNSLKKGHVIIYPSDTIWGIGCDVMNEAAIERVFFIKKRDRSHALPLLVDSIEMLKTYVPRLHPRVETLLSHHRQPLTIIYKHTANLPDYALANDKTAAIRVCLDPFCSEVIERFGRPILSTSANIGGELYPKSFNEINLDLLASADYICSYRRDELMDIPPSVIATYNHKGELDFIRE
jgi:L-threonylcarbamoyladenylate synthase